MAGHLIYVKGEKNMAKPEIAYAKDNEYYTPKSVVDYFGKFDYDPATVQEKAEEFGIKNYDTIETDGLSKDWTIYKKIWINPPFTEKHKFLKRAAETYKMVKNDIYILFPIEFLTTDRFKKAIEGVGVKLFIPNGRINFQSGLGKKGKSPAFGSVIAKIQDNFEVEFIDKEEL